MNKNHKRERKSIRNLERWILTLRVKNNNLKYNRKKFNKDNKHGK
jgi:hypothetical protein